MDVTSLRLCVAGPDDRPHVEAILAAADLSSRQPPFLRFTLETPGLRTWLAWQGDDLVGTALAASFGRTGWIGNVAVHPGHRRHGVGRSVTEAALAWLMAGGAVRVRLLATEMGRRLYQGLGFEPEGEPWDKYTIAPGLVAKGPTAVTSASLAACLAADEAATGDRREHLLGPFDDRLLGVPEGDGYGLALPWGGGPVVASTPDVGHALWWHVYGAAAGQRWAVPHENRAARELAQAYGLVHAGTSLPMRYGLASGASGRPDRVWAAWSLAVG